MIFQLQDDPSRPAVATHVADGETSEAALTVVKKGIKAHGVPQRLLTDNGAALNPTRRGIEGKLVTYVSSLGVKAITGKPYKPTTQGKNERFHQTLFRWLNKQPLAATLRELQDLVDRFDLIYNTERPHQGLPGRITPQQSWAATVIAEAPRPQHVPTFHPAPAPAPTAPTRDETAASTTDTETPKTGTGTGTGQNVGLGLEATTREKISGTVPHPADRGSQKLRVYSNGVVKIGKTTYSLTKQMRGQIVFALWDSQGVMFANTDGEVIAEYLWPPEGTGYVGAGQSLTRFRQTPLYLELSPMS